MTPRRYTTRQAFMPRRSRLMHLRLFLVGVAVLGGCIAAPGSSLTSNSIPTNQPTSGTIPLPSSATVTPDPSETAVPQEPYAEPEFWDRFGGTDMQTVYGSLREIAAASDVVLVATVEDVVPGRKIPVPETGETEYMATMTLTVDDVIRGSVQSAVGSPGTVQVETLLSFNPPGSILNSMIQSAPKGRQVLLFLANRTADVLRHGLPPTHPAAADDYYFVLTGIEGYVLNVGGKAKISRDADVDWLRAFDAQPFEDVVSASRSAAAGG